MKGIIYALFLLLAFALNSFGQIVPNSKMQEVYSSSELSEFPESRIQYLNYLSESGWMIKDAPADKSEHVSNLPYLFETDHSTKTISAKKMDASDIGTFNLLKYNYSIGEVQNMYRIDGSNKILVIKSHEDITKGFNEYRNQ